MRKAKRTRAIDASPLTVRRGRRSCTGREISCTEAGTGPNSSARELSCILGKVNSGRQKQTCVLRFRRLTVTRDSTPALLKSLLDNYAYVLRKNHHGKEARTIEARAAALQTRELTNGVVDTSELLAELRTNKK